MKAELTERNTYRITWGQGELEINLIPANGHLPTTSYASLGFNGQLIFLHDNVGIVGLCLNGCPPVPRICWDNREHHFWQGFNGAFRPRNTAVNAIQVESSADDSQVRVSCYYISDYVKTTISWLFREPEEDCAIAWDTFFSVENLSDQPMKQYMTFFACYHQPGTNYYWDRHDQIAECTDSFNGSPDEDKQQRASEMTDAFSKQVKESGWTAGIENPTTSTAIYGKPVLLSEPREWYGGKQHILMVEPEKCLLTASAMRQARDYMLAPVETDLNPRSVFTARVRHVIARIDGMNDLRPHWERFVADCGSGRSKVVRR